jgi:hypothetical protein
MEMGSPTLLRFELPKSIAKREGAGETLTEYMEIVFPGPGIIGSRTHIPTPARHSESDEAESRHEERIKETDKPIAGLARKPGNLATLGLRT